MSRAKRGFAAGVNPDKLAAALGKTELKKARHKFGAVRTELDGIKFSSRAEAEYYAHLKLLEKSGEIVGFMRQPVFYLPGGTRYVADFLIFWADGTVDTRDVKGHLTAEFKVKWREVKTAYPFMTFLQVKKSGKGWMMDDG